MVNKFYVKDKIGRDRASCFEGKSFEFVDIKEGFLTDTEDKWRADENMFVWFLHNGLGIFRIENIADCYSVHI